MLNEIINLDGEKTYIFLRSYLDGVNNARKLYGGDDE